MLNKISVAVGLVLVVVYLGGYAALLKAPPLWIIIVAVLAMIVVETIEAYRAGDDDGAN